MAQHINSKRADEHLPHDYQPYDYQPLENPEQQIRLLRLCAAEEHTEIFCEIFYESLDTITNKYIALSYVWGSPNEIEYIICTDAQVKGPRILKVTQSLYKILKNLQNHNKWRCLWIDQICIQQDDKNEKISQITIMDSIYRNAKEVILWLGEESKQMARAIHLLDTTNVWDIDLPKEDIAALNIFFNSPWFTRLWVVQEAACATKATAMCGSSTLPWAKVILSAKRLSERFSLITCANAAKMGLFTCNILLTELAEARGSPAYILRDLPLSRRLLLFMELFRSFRCSQQEDRYLAFGAYGFWRHSTWNFEYMARKWSPKEFFTFMTYTAVKYPGNEENVVNNLSPICSAGARNHQRFPSWPSWVPDYTFEGTINKPLLPYGFLTSGFNASGRWDYYSTIFNLTTGLRVIRRMILDAVYKRQDPTLILQGKEISVVNEVLGQYLPSSHEGDLGLESYRSAASTICQWMNKVRALNSQEDTQQFINDFGRMLVADGWMDIPELCRPKRRFPPEVSSTLFSTLLDIWTSMPDELQLLRHQKENPALRQYMEAITECCRGQRLFILENCLYGLCPSETQKGDLVCLFYGGKVPFVLRQIKCGSYILIGDSYINGIMYGEATCWWEVWTQTFNIV